MPARLLTLPTQGQNVLPQAQPQVAQPGKPRLLTVPKPTLPQKSTVNKIGEGIDTVLKGPSQFLFGTSAPAIGNVIGAGVESAYNLAGKESPSKGVFTKGANEMLGAKAGVGTSAKNIAFTALETYPGGAEFTDALKAIAPEIGGKIADGLSKIIEHIPEALREKAIKQYTEALKPTTKEGKALAQEVAPEMAKRKMIFTSAEGLKATAEKEGSQFGAKIGEFFDTLSHDAKTTIRPILGKLQDFKNQFIVEGKVIKPQAINAVEKVQSDIAELSSKGEMKSESLRKLRQIFDKHFSISKGIDDISSYEKQVERVAGDSIREELAKSHPELDKLNKQYSFWRNVADVANLTAEREVGKTKKRVAGTILGGTAGYLAGNGLGQKTEFAAAGAFLGEKAADFFTSPAWKTVSAASKSQLADMIAKGDLNGAGLFINKLSEGTINQISPSVTGRK